MAVIINEFEVLPPDPPPAAQQPAAQNDAPRATLSPHELQRLLERQAERARRVRAH